MRIEKREDEFKAKDLQLLKKRAPQILTLVIQDIRHSGYPDVVTNGGHRTCWWEYKHGTPDFAGTELQELTCHRLASKSFCRYIIYQEDRYGDKRTLIVHPREVRARRKEGGWLITAEEAARGFDHEFVVDYILAAHRGLKDYLRGTS